MCLSEGILYRREAGARQKKWIYPLKAINMDVAEVLFEKKALNDAISKRKLTQMRSNSDPND